MKKMLAWFLFFFQLLWSVWGQSITLSVNTTEVDIFWSFSLTVQIDPGASRSLKDIQLAWVSDFEILSKSQRQQTQIVNWAMTQQVFISFQLAPKELWTYSLWPASVLLDGWVTQSNTIDMVISDLSAWWRVEWVEWVDWYVDNELSFRETKLFTWYLVLVSLVVVLCRLLYEEIKKEKMIIE